MGCGCTESGGGDGIQSQGKGFTRRSILGALGAGVALAAAPLGLRRASADDPDPEPAQQQQPTCRLVLQTGPRGAPPYTWICQGDCPPLFDGQDNEVAGRCTIVRRANPQGEAAGPKECVCVYEPTGGTCEIVRDAKTGNFSCKGDCPELFTKKAGERGRQKVKGQCIRVEMPVAGGYQVVCVCVY